MSSSSGISMSALLRKCGPLLGLVAVWTLFALSAGPVFMDWDNVRLMLLQTAVVGTAAVGATLIIIAGGIDLSVGSTIAFGTVAGALVARSGGSPWLVALSAPLAGALIGFGMGAMIIGHIVRVALAIVAAFVGWKVSQHYNSAAGWSVALAISGVGFLLDRKYGRRLELSPFIVSLGLWGAIRGAAKGLGDNQPVYPSYEDLGFITELMVIDPESKASLPAGVWILIGVSILGAVLLRYTRLGRELTAIGSNEATAHLCGVDVPRTKLIVYSIGIAAAGIAALLQLSFLSMGDPSTASGYELQVIAAVVIGGASLAGGEGSILGTVIGALIMTMVDNGCTKVGLDNWVQETVTGGIIVGAVAIDQLRRGKPS